MTDRNWYSVLVEFRERPDSGAPITDEAIDQFLDNLSDWSPAVSGGPGYGDYGARVSIPTTNSLAACEDALRIVNQAAVYAGLPAGSVIRLQATREDALDEDLARSPKPDLVSAPEAAEMLGVSAQRVHTLASSNPSFPEPAYRFRAGKVWYRAAIAKFNAEWTRKAGWPKGRPRKVAEAEMTQRAMEQYGPALEMLRASGD